MNQYFFKVTSDYWVAQNRLQEDAKKSAREIDRILVPEQMLEGFVEAYIYNAIKKLNLEHSRCKPLRVEKASSYTHSGSEESYIIPGVTHITRYLVKNHL